MCITPTVDEYPTYSKHMQQIPTIKKLFVVRNETVEFYFIHPHGLLADFE